MNPSMKRERQKSFKRKPDLLNTAMAVSAGVTSGDIPRRPRGDSLRRQNSGGKDSYLQHVGIHHDGARNSLLPNSPPSRSSDKGLRRSGSVSASMSGGSGGLPRRSRAGSTRHHSYHYHPSSPRPCPSPRPGQKRSSRGGSTSSDPPGSPSNSAPHGNEKFDPSAGTPQTSPRLFPGSAQKSPVSKTSSIAVGASDDVITLPHPAEDTSLIELQQYIEQHPAVLRVHLDDAFRYVMRASGVQLAVAIAMAVDAALATYTWLDSTEVLFEHVIYILPPASVTVLFLIVTGLVGVVGIYKRSERSIGNKNTVFLLKSYFILLTMTLIFGNLTLAGSALTALRGMFEHGPANHIIWFSLPMVGLCSIILVLTSRVILSLYRKGSSEWCPGNVIHFTGIPLETIHLHHRKTSKMHSV